MDWNQIGQTLHLGGTIAAVVAIYSLFKFLDGKASASANKTLLAWLRGEEYRRLDLRNVVVSAFDSLYGAPLLRVRSFLRSAVLSVCAYLIYLMFEVAVITKAFGFEYVLTTLIVVFMLVLPFVILADYISLFIVRRCLTILRINVGEAIVLAILGGLGWFLVAAVLMTSVMLSQTSDYGGDPFVSVLSM